MQWLKQIGKFLKEKNILVCLLILFALALLWLLLPHMGLTSYKLRISLILSLLGIFILVNLVRIYLNRKRGANLEQGMSQANDKNFARQMELDALKAQMHSAIAELKQSSLGSRYSGKSLLYVLPWYILIGPSAAGKTTLLRNSGLDFPMSNEDEIKVKGFGGTRNCDWWFASEGIVLDTAGRYTTEPDDRAEWLGFLNILKKCRRKRPINGVIIAFSLLDLLTLDEAKLLQHAKIIRDRITELYQDLGFIVPCYFIITKFDLLKGFVEYYANLTDAQRTSVFGAAIDNLRAVSLVEQIKQGLEQIYQFLIRARDEKLSLERKTYNKFVIYDFPEQFKACWPQLLQFFNVLSKVNPYQQQPAIVGLYFTSGTQEGMPLEQITNKLSQAFGMPDTPDHSHEANSQFKQYFIRDLFKKVIFGQYEIAIPIIKHTKRQQRIKLCIIVFLLGLISTAIIGGYRQYQFAVKKLVTSIELAQTLTEYYIDAHSKHITRLDSLSRLFNFYQTLTSHKSNSLISKLFMPESNKHFISAYKTLFDRVMILEFLIPVKYQLLNTLANQYYLWQQTEHHSLDQRGSYMATFQAFIMLSLPQYMQSKNSIKQLTQLWFKHINDNRNAALMSNSNIQQSMLKEFLSDLQANPKQYYSYAMSMETLDLIKPVQRQLLDKTLATNLYGLIQYQALQQLSWLSLDKFSQRYNLTYLQSNYKIPALFTRHAWHDYVAPKIHELVFSNGDGWLLTKSITKVVTESHQVINNGKARRLSNHIKQKYFQAYNQNWQQFLMSIRIDQVNTLAQATDMLKTMSEANGTMQDLLQLINNNLIVNNGSFKGSKSQSINKKQIKNYLNSLRQIQVELQQLANSPSPADQCLQLVKTVLAGNGANTSFVKASLMVDHILEQQNIKPKTKLWHHILLMPIIVSWQTVLRNAGISLEKKWQQQIYPNYAQGLQGHFPFARSDNDANASDVINLLSPRQGLLVQFYHQNILPLINTEKKIWIAKTWLGYGIPFTKSFLSQLKSMLDLGNLLFKFNGNELDLSYQVYPIPTPGLTSIVLEHNGQKFQYHNGPQEWRRYTWPSDWQNGDTALVIYRMHDSCVADITSTGLWGLFHLLAKAKLKLRSQSVVQATWRMHCHGASYSVCLLFKIDKQNKLPELLTFNEQLPRYIVASEKE